MKSQNLQDLLCTMVELDASDLFLTTGAAPLLKVDGTVSPLDLPALSPGEVRALAYSAMGEKAIAEFERTLEYNMAYAPPDIGRFRLNIYQQRGEVGLVARQIRREIPEYTTLALPKAVQDLAQLSRGLVLIIGASGSGKTTTMASLVDYRSRHQAGHILTVEDPIEYMFTHGKSTVDQREIGADTLSFSNALRNAMRQSPDMIVIGEIRDRESMEHAIAFAETGQFCMSTLHATNAAQAIKRILNFFPGDMHPQVLMDLSLNLRAIVAQRLIPGLSGRRVLATEVLLRSSHVSDLIQRGAIDALQASIEKTSSAGSHSFDQCLIELFRNGSIDQETALDNANSRTDLGLHLRLHSGYETH